MGEMPMPQINLLLCVTHKLLERNTGECIQKDYKRQSKRGIHVKHAAFFFKPMYITIMPDEIKLKEKYILAKCCSPSLEDKIVGYYSHDNYLKVHRHDCTSLKKAEPTRLVALSWDDILEDAGFAPGQDYDELEVDDFAVLRHHLDYGIDYSLMVAKSLAIPKQDAFERHKRLRDLGLLQRVEPRIVQYRKGIVDNKWIKHRNHTYYELTEKGKAYLDYHRTHNS